MTGEILAVLQKKGYGFIRDEDGQERFFHANSVMSGDVKSAALFTGLEIGMKVRFKAVEIQGKGLRAENVEVIV